MPTALADDMRAGLAGGGAREMTFRAGLAGGGARAKTLVPTAAGLPLQVNIKGRWH